MAPILSNPVLIAKYIEGLNDTEKNVLKQLKERLADVQDEFDDLTGIRFLRARNLNVDKTEKMLRDHLKWRTALQLDSLIDTYKPPEIFVKYPTYHIIGHDNDGAPIVLLCPGTWDVSGMFQCCTIEELLLYVVAGALEQVRKDLYLQSEKLGKVVHTAIVILDYEGFSIRHIYNRKVLQIVPRLFQLYEANYPESLKFAFDINVPKFFPILWNITAPFLHEETVKKLKVLTKDDPWKEELLKVISPDQLPVHYGGTRVGENGCQKCSDIFPMGGTIDLKYYHNVNSKIAEHLKNHPSAKVIRVPRRDKCEELLRASKGLQLEWSFQTVQHDIAFGLRYRNETGRETQLIEPGRVNSHIVPEQGCYQCEYDGTYIMEFDNTFSWFTDKEVFYEVAVKDPNQNDSIIDKEFTQF